jgi:hypothetical protein
MIVSKHELILNFDLHIVVKILQILTEALKSEGRLIYFLCSKGYGLYLQPL